MALIKDERCEAQHGEALQQTPTPLPPLPARWATLLSAVSGAHDLSIPV
jgi:hypothetical protein